MAQKKSSERLVRDIKRITRRKYSSEEKIRIVIEGMRGEVSIAELCRKEGIAQNLYYRWSKDFMESGKKRLDGDTMREANTSEVQSLKKENTQLKEAVAELLLQNRIYKKSMSGEDSSE
jgi:transposase